MHTNSYKSIDADEYLPLVTLQWCCQVLASENIDLSKLRGGDTFADGTRVHRTAYLRLREHARNYIHQGMQPALEETPSPAGGYRFYEEMDGVIARIVRENAQTVIQSSGEIRTIPIHMGPAPDPNWVREDLSV
jgi:hypothetical protein